MTIPASARMLVVRWATAGVGNRSAEEDAAAHRGHPGGDRGLDHVPAEARVLADEDAGGVVLSPPGHEGDGPPEGEGQLRGHGVDVGHRPDAVGAEQGTGVGSRRGQGFLLAESGRAFTSAGSVSDDAHPRVTGGDLDRHRERSHAVVLRRDVDVGTQVGGGESAEHPLRAADLDTDGGGDERGGLAPDGDREALEGLAAPRLPDATPRPGPRSRRPRGAGAGPRGSTLTDFSRSTSAPSTETGSVKALSISWTRLRGPATLTSDGSLT